jgi:hypothetical protein
MTRSKSIIFVFLLLLSFFLFGQNRELSLTHYDSTRVVSFNIHKIDTTVFIENSSNNIDTNSRYFHQYDPIRRTYDFYTNIGNIGAVSQNMVFRPVLKSGFSYGNNSLMPYIKNDLERNFLFSLLPFTDLYFSSGMKREQVFHVTHLHNVRNKLFIGVNYRIINAPGRDNYHQKTNSHVVSTFMYYQTKNKRYGIFTDYLFSKIKNQENGGLTDDTIYLNYRMGKSATVPEYYLTKAENLVKESTVHLKQYYSFVKKDSIFVNDTTKRLKTFFLGRIIHSFDFIHQKSRFTNGLNAGYFPIIPNDTSTIADSCVFYQIKNSLEWNNSEAIRRDGTSSIFQYSVKVTHTYSEIDQWNEHFHFINLLPSLSLEIRPFKNFTVDASGDYVLLNKYAGDYTSSATIAYEFVYKEKSFGKITLEGDYHKKEADWFYQHYHSTYFRWDNDFAKEEILHGGLNYTYKNLKVGADYYNLFNPVYMDAASRPNQYVNGTIQVFSAYLYKRFMFWKFEIDNKVVYQYTDKPTLLRKPQLIASQTYVFSTHMFKKALFLQLGVDLTYNTKYYGDAYQPATRSFYLQNTRQIGNYLYADAFLNLKIKRFRIFFQLTNFLSGAIGYDNFTVPHYPMQDRVFKFGVNWLFHD